MYRQYFGLREDPFALPPDPRYLYLSARYQEALAHLTYGITQAGGFVQITGEVGTGKTMIVRALLERLPSNVHAALILYPFLSVEEFITAILDDLRIPRPAKPESVKVLIDALNDYLIESHAKGRRTVLIIDEAQKLSHEVLEQVRLLTNLETTKDKLLQILLVGQPELDNLLAQPDLRQLAQRITARYRLTALEPEETAEYVRHRLRVAGATSPLFTRSALAGLHRLSRGTPRLINVVADRALLGAYGQGKNEVSAAMVRRAAAEIGHPTPRRWGFAAAAAAAGLVALGILGWQLWPDPTPLEPEVTLSTAVPSVVPIVEPPAEQPNAETPVPKPALAELFAQNQVALDTDSALTALFAQWRQDYTRLPGETGCERAQAAGLRCVYSSGNWNTLRQLNRPSVIELMDDAGARHHVLVRHMSDERVGLEIGGEVREFALAEVERYWYGKLLSLWTPPPGGDGVLRRGMRGPGVAWLRTAIARYNGEAPSKRGATFDAALEAQVKEFQRRHGLDDDGIVGRSTLIQLDGYGTVAPRLVAKSNEGVS